MFEKAGRNLRRNSRWVHAPRRWASAVLLALAALLGTDPSLATITYVQSNSVSPSSSVSTLSVPFTTAQSAGDLIVVGVSWGSSATISSIADTKGNTYTLAVGPTTFSGAASAIYYAKNIAAAAATANTVTVTFNTSTGSPDLRVAEYSGVDTTNPLDVTAVSTGTSATSNSGSATTSNANDLLVGSNAVLSGTTAAGTGYTSRQISTFDGNILEDRIVSTTGAYSATAPLSSSAAWIMQMAAFKAAGSGDTTPPSAPSGLTAAAASASQINLSWTAATDNVGVTGYRVERCQGTGCSTFAQVGTPAGISFSDTGLSASTSYSYRVRSTDAAGNLSGYSNTATASTSANPIAYVQSNSVSPNNSSVTTLSVPFTAAQNAGDLIVVGVSWSTNATLSTLTDTKGNSYTLAVGPTTLSTAVAAIYYAKNIVASAAGANTVTATFSTGTGFPDLRVAEYSGISTTSPLDVTAVSTGTSTTSDSGAATTTNANDLLVGSNAVFSGTPGAGTGYTSRQISAWDGNILEDRIVSTTGAYSASAPVSPSAGWIMQMAAFKAAGSGGDTTSPTTPTGLTVTAASASQINLSWTASTDNVGVTGYRVERCQGTGCSTFAQVGAPAGTSFSDTGLSASTSYSYRVRATDAAGNLSGYSSVVSTTTMTGGGGDTTPPAQVTGLAATVISTTQINLSWTAATDNVGVTGYRVERCAGTSCTNFVQVGSPSATNYSDTGLLAGTTYRYQARAGDFAGNLGAYSSPPVNATTGTSGDIQAPTAPTLSILAASSTEIDLVWSGATDNVGVVSYDIDKCVGGGSGCTFISSSGSPLYDSGLTPGTLYTYGVRARDAAGNAGAYSNAVSLTTPAASQDCN